jgi:hypothetical protein
MVVATASETEGQGSNACQGGWFLEYRRDEGQAWLAEKNETRFETETRSFSTISTFFRHFFRHFRNRNLEFLEFFNNFDIFFRRWVAMPASKTADRQNVDNISDIGDYIRLLLTAHPQGPEAYS